MSPRMSIGTLPGEAGGFKLRLILAAVGVWPRNVEDLAGEERRAKEDGGSQIVG